MAELPAGTVTFLFTDIEGSTRLWEEHREAMRTALARHDEILRETIATHSGAVFSTGGDGFAAAFTRAAEAVRAALAVQIAISGERWPETTPIRVRIGVHTGEVEERGADYFGPAVNRTARLMAIGHGGQVLVSAATAAVVSDALPAQLRLRDLGEHRLRDLSAPMHVFQLVHGDLRADFPPLRTAETIPGNLPLELSTFVGRHGDLAGLAAAVKDSRLVTVVGVGGVGKTRLAIHAAAELAPKYPDGVWLCELAGADDADSMHQLVASTVGITSRPGLDMRGSIIEYLVPKAMLLVLDNCEHLIDAAAELADFVRNKCPGVSILATSREPLAVDGERIFPLRSLSLPPENTSDMDFLASEAVQLFVERATGVYPGFTLTDSNSKTVVEVCRRLDGIPLAIELAAARVASMTPGEIAAHLDERFRLLAGRRRGTVERHQTLRATLDWSYSLLSDAERLVFNRLGVFAASFDADGAVAVTAEGIESWDVIDALASLTAKSMLVADTAAENTTRYRLLETMRHYARERLGAEGDDPDHWWERHAEYYAALARVIGEALNAPKELLWRRRLALELDDLRAAVNWSLDRQDDDRCNLIIAALHAQAAEYETAGIGAWAQRCLERAGAAPPALRTAILSAASWEAFRMGDPKALELGLEALSKGLTPGWPSSYLPHLALAAAWLARGDLENARAVAAEGHIALDSADAPPIGHAHLFAFEASLPALEAGSDAARQFADDALASAETYGRTTGLAVALFAVGRAYLDSDPDRATTALDQSIALTRDGAGDGVYALALIFRARLASRIGNARYAIILVDEAACYGRDSANRISVGGAVTVAIEVMASIGEAKTAAILAGASANAVLGVYWTPAEQSENDDVVARLRHELSPSAFEEALARGHAMSYEEVVGFLLSELARVRT